MKISSINLEQEETRGCWGRECWDLIGRLSTPRRHMRPADSRENYGHCEAMNRMHATITGMTTRKLVVLSQVEANEWSHAWILEPIQWGLKARSYPVTADLTSAIVNVGCGDLKHPETSIRMQWVFHDWSDPNQPFLHINTCVWYISPPPTIGGQCMYAPGYACQACTSSQACSLSSMKIFHAYPAFFGPFDLQAKANACPHAIWSHLGGLSSQTLIIPASQNLLKRQS